MCPPPESPAHFPSCLKIEADTVWRAPGSCAADTPVTPVCSGAETLAHGRRCSTLTQGDINMSPGPLAMASAPTSWEGGKVKWREPDGTQEPGFFNIRHSKCEAFLQSVCDSVLLQQGLFYSWWGNSNSNRRWGHQEHCVCLQCWWMATGSSASKHREVLSRLLKLLVRR